MSELHLQLRNGSTVGVQKFTGSQYQKDGKFPTSALLRLRTLVYSQSWDDYDANNSTLRFYNKTADTYHTYSVSAGLYTNSELASALQNLLSGDFTSLTVSAVSSGTRNGSLLFKSDDEMELLFDNGAGTYYPASAYMFNNSSPTKITSVQNGAKYDLYTKPLKSDRYPMLYLTSNIPYSLPVGDNIENYQQDIIAERNYSISGDSSILCEVPHCANANETVTYQPRNMPTIELSSQSLSRLRLTLVEPWTFSSVDTQMWATFEVDFLYD